MNQKVKITLMMLLGVAMFATILFSTTKAQAHPAAQATATAGVTPTAMVMNDQDGIDMTAASKYCTDKGGTVAQRYPTYNTNAPQKLWLRLAGAREFCTFYANADSAGFQSQISI